MSSDIVENIRRLSHEPNHGTECGCFFWKFLYNVNDNDFFALMKTHFFNEGNFMVDYSDMDKFLANAEEKDFPQEDTGFFDRKEIPLFHEKQTEEREFSEELYQVRKSGIERIRERLEQKLSVARTRYDGVDVEEKKKRSAILYNLVIFMVFVGAGAYLLHRFLGTNVMTMVCFGAIGVLGIAVAVHELFKVVNELTTLLVRSGKATRLVEEAHIKTYGKEREFELKRIHNIQDRLNELRDIDKKLDKNHGLTDEEYRQAEQLSLIPEIDNPYKVESITFGEYVKFYLFGHI